MRLRDYLELIRDRLALVLLITVIVAGADLAITLASPPSYQAATRIRLIVNTGGQNQTVVQQALGDIATEGQLVTSTAVADRVRQDLHLSVPAPTLINQITVIGVGGAQQVLEVEATAANSAYAVRLANGFAKAYLEVRSAQLLAAVDQATSALSSELSSVLSALQAEDAQLASLPPTSLQYSTVAAERDSSNGQLVALQGELQSLAGQRVAAAGFGQVIQPATSATVVRSRALDRTVLFGVLIGLPLGIAVVLLLDSFRNVVRGRNEVEQQAGVDVLGVVPFDPGWVDPTSPRVVTEEDPLSPTAEAYRSLAVTLRRSARGSGVHVVLVTSAGPAEGRTATAVNLSVAMAEAGVPTVFVEADIRRPRGFEALGADYVPGFVELLRGDVGTAEVIQRLRPNLRYVGPGVVNERAELLFAGSEFRQALDEIAGAVGRERSAYPSVTRLGSRDGGEAGGAEVPVQVIVVVDAGSILESPEAVLAAGVVDGVLLVARSSVSTRSGLARAAEQVKHSRGTLVGALLVGSRSPEDLGITSVAAQGRLRSFLSRRAS